jgi:hypothetical protein
MKFIQISVLVVLIFASYQLVANSSSRRINVVHYDKSMSIVDDLDCKNLMINYSRAYYGLTGGGSKVANIRRRMSDQYRLDNQQCRNAALYGSNHSTKR